jgi:4-hydroxy-tetrahydrodipicolinate synthase
VPISPELAGRLSRDFPGNFVAYKDSTGDWDNTLAVINAAPGLSVFPGSEGLMTKAMDHGGAGCISATVNLNAQAMRDVFDAKIAGSDTNARENAMNRFRVIIQRAGLIPAMKTVLAVRYGDERWLNLKPPLLNATMELGHQVLAELGALAEHIVKPD